jgi:hypothetical protein
MRVVVLSVDCRLPERATVVLYYAVDWPEAPMTISTATAIYNASVNAKVKKRIATCGILMCEYKYITINA